MQNRRAEGNGVNLWESVGKAKSGPKPLDMVPPLLYLRPRRNPPWRGPPVPIPLRRKERNERKTEMKSTAQTPSRAKPIPRMRRDARATLRQRALAGDADAMCEYGGRLAEDPATREEGLAWEIRSAEAGACFGAFNAAMTCSMLGRPTECIRWLRRARRDGERSADLCLGVSAAAGYGVPRDLARAARLFRAVLRSTPVSEVCLSEMDDAAGFLAMLADGRPIRIAPAGIGGTHPKIGLAKTIAFAGTLRGRTPEFLYWRGCLRMERRSHFREAIADFSRAARILQSRSPRSRADGEMLADSRRLEAWLSRQ